MTAATAPIIRQAPAKLNLALHVVGKRRDGYHLLDSLVGFTALGDVIAAAPGDQLTLEIDGPYGATLSAADDENLVLRAARALAARLDIPARAQLRLTKNLPVASGIGGGSSDAAATLLALVDLWQADLPSGDLEEIGLRLGADVPVCLAGVPARLQGVGESITELPSYPATPILLVNPNRGLSTPSVFKARNGAFGGGIETELLHRTASDPSALAAALRPLRNDLTEPACALMPQIAEILAALEAIDECLLARMSGSGATCFALFPTVDAASAGAERLTAARPDWWIAPTMLRANRLETPLMSDPETIYNWRRLDDRITTSGQPTEAELAALQALGVRQIVNLGLHSHEKALPDEAASVARLGMSYTHIPVDFKNPTEADFSRFCEVMARLRDEPIHVHCIANYRVSAFFYRYRRDTLGRDEAAIRPDLDAIWRPDGVWADFIARR